MKEHSIKDDYFIEYLITATQLRWEILEEHIDV